MMLLGGPVCERAESGTILTGSLLDVDTLCQLADDQNCGLSDQNNAPEVSGYLLRESY